MSIVVAHCVEGKQRKDCQSVPSQDPAADLANAYDDYGDSMNKLPARRQIGYARVSTDEQNLDLQIQALKRAGCDVIYTDSGVSGGIRSRPGLDKALRAMRRGDKLVVWRLDRLGRSLVHLVQLLDSLGKRQVRFHSMCESIDTSSSGGRLIFHMMAALAEFECSLISERTRAGMAAARARGQHVGRLPSLTREQCLKAQSLLSTGMSPQSVAMRFDVKPRTLLRLVERVRQSQEQVPAIGSTDAHSELAADVPGHAPATHDSDELLPQPGFDDRTSRHEAESHAVVEHGKAPADQFDIAHSLEDVLVAVDPLVAQWSKALDPSRET